MIPSGKDHIESEAQVVDGGDAVANTRKATGGLVRGAIEGVITQVVDDEMNEDVSLIPASSKEIKKLAEELTPQQSESDLNLKNVDFAAGCLEADYDEGNDDKVFSADSAHLEMALAALKLETDGSKLYCEGDIAKDSNSETVDDFIRAVNAVTDDSLADEKEIVKKTRF